MSDKEQQLIELKQQCLDCRKCEVGGRMVEIKGGKYLSNVFSNMCMKAQIMVVGQNPGGTEVVQGVPFVGPSGTNFDKAIKQVLEIDRSYFYISNTIRCHTPNNRSPSSDEIEQCRCFIDREVEIIKPKLILTLGSWAMQRMTGMSGMMKNRGKKVISPRYGIDVIPMLHPCPVNLMRKANKDFFYEDFELVKPYL